MFCAFAMIGESTDGNAGGEIARDMHQFIKSVSSLFIGDCLQYWKIVAGHKEKDPDETKSLILGDWLRHNYIAIGWGEKTPQGKVFKKDIQVGDKVVVVTDGYVWALGTIEEGTKDVDLTSSSHLYPNQRKVTWSKITKVEYRNFPKFLYNKLKLPKALNKLNREDWETLLTCIL